jgi:hypothetical protein
MGRWNQQDAVDSHAVSRGPGGGEMCVVDRVEGAAKDRNQQELTVT